MPPLDDDCQEDRREDGWRPLQATRPNTGMEDDDDDDDDHLRKFKTVIFLLQSSWAQPLGYSPTTSSLHYL
jgi:hypothetical protein